MIQNVFISAAVLSADLLFYQQTGFSMPFWGWLLLFMVITMIIILLVRSSDKKDEIYDREPDTATINEELFLGEDAAQVKMNQIIEPNPSASGDDLTVIEGIGPKISEFLRRSGITTFQRLAGMDLDELERMLADANFGIADPETWAEQAGLAARGEWKALKDLQDKLTGGRRKK